MNCRQAENGDCSERGGGGVPLGSVFAPGPRRGAVSIVSPQQMTIDDVFQTVEQSGGDLSCPPPPSPGVSTEWTEEIMAEDTSGREECPHDDIEIRP